MANTGNLFPGTGESLSRGQTAWTNPGNITSDNATDAGCVGTAGSDYLVARNFDFSSIPDGAQIVGFLARIEASEHSGGTEALHSQLQDASGALTGTEKTNTNEGNLSGTAKAVYTFGSTSDLWGTTGLTGASVKDVDFGVRFWFVTAHTVNVDYVTLAVEYTTGQTGTTATATATVTTHGASVTLGGVAGTAALAAATASALAAAVTLGGITGIGAVASVTATAADASATQSTVAETATASLTATALDASVPPSGQLAVPISVVTRDSWTDEGGGTTDLYTHIDDGVTWNDADYVRSPVAPGETDELVVGLTALGLPQAGTVSVVVRAGTI